MAGIPQDASDDWPAPKGIRSFYFCRFRSYEEPKRQAKIEQAEKDLQKKNQNRFQIIQSLKEKRSERAYVISHLKLLTGEAKQYRIIIDEMRKDMEPLTTALSKLRNVNGSGKEKGVNLCSSVEELDDFIRSLHYRIQHESNTLSEEKQLVKEIQQLEATREKVIANVAMKAKIQEVIGYKETIQYQLMGVDMDTLKKEQQAVRTEIKGLEEELKAIDDEIDSLQDELAVVTDKRNKARDALSKLRKERDGENACFYQNRSVLATAKSLAARKDIAAVEELCFNEMEKFMSQWNGSKAFRDDYERRILTSLDMRQLSRDGRIRNPGEKTIMEELRPAKTSPVAPSEITSKPAKEVGAAPLPRPHVVGTHKAREGVGKLTEAELKGKYDRPEDSKASHHEIEKHQEEPKGKEIDAATLKDMKRKEEMLKAKLAMERKKKLAEKATAKAAARAQREAEKKMKEKEKRAKKKVGTKEPAVSTEEIKSEAKSPELEQSSLRMAKPDSCLTWAAVAAAAIIPIIFSVVGWYYFGRN